MNYNAVHCNICGETIVSQHRHDYVRCACTDESFIAVDGGFEYRRRVFGEFCNYTELRVKVEPTPPLEHTDVVLVGVHSPLRCEGRPCTIHNRSAHSKRSWVQHWDPRRGMRRISPTTGRSYRDPDEWP